MAKRKKRKKQNNKFKVFLVLLIIIGIPIAYFLLTNNINISFDKRIPQKKVEIKDIENKTNVSEAIAHAVKLLGIPDKLFKNNVLKDKVYIRLGINRDEMDLNYANMIITGQVEIAKGKLVSGIEKNSGTRQVLEFLDPADSQEIQVILYYASGGSYGKKKPLLSIVVDDFGYFSGTLLDDFCKLDPAVTFAVLPDLTHSVAAMQMADESGHETIIHIPMEPQGYPKNNPGDNAIFVHLSEKQIIKRMKHYIKQLPLCIGANNHMGSLATADKDVMQSVLEVLKREDMYFVDSRTSSSSIAFATAREMLMKTHENMLFLDSPDISEATFKTKLNRLKQLKEKNDKVLVITHCKDKGKLAYLQRMINAAETMGYQLVPVSELFKNKLPEFL